VLLDELEDELKLEDELDDDDDGQAVGVILYM
jgi:hypothetical protein